MRKDKNNWEKVGRSLHPEEFSVSAGCFGDHCCLREVMGPPHLEPFRNVKTWSVLSLMRLFLMIIKFTLVLYTKFGNSLEYKGETLNQPQPPLRDNVLV